MSYLEPPPPPLSASTPPARGATALDALSPAWENTKRILFDPFSLRKWFKLGLIAFLAQAMASGGANFNVRMPLNFPTGGPGGPGGPGGLPAADFERFWHEVLGWYHAHGPQIIAGAVALVGLGLILSLILTYVSSVFRFIFLESVITSETQIRESWVRNRAEGASFFLWRLAFGFVSLLIVALFVGGPAVAIYKAIGWRPGGPPPTWSTIAGCFGLFMLAMLMFVIALIIVGIVAALTRDFVLPLMYLRRIGVLEGWRQFWPILGAHKGGFLVYFLMKIVVTILAGIIMVILSCFGGLVAMIPLAVLGLIGYGMVQAAGIHSWDWSYLWALVPLGIVLSIGLGYWMNCVVLPIPVYFQSYALKYLGYVEPEAETV
jgi:hypothetical protein